jgi:RNA 2',3'-cyclic 3'-phosphodiesterase
MKRLFAAVKIDPGEEFLEGFREMKSAFSHEPVKWVEEHNIHITLKFFGDTEEAKISAIARELGEVSSGTKGFVLRLKNLGIFGSAYDPRVIWVGIEPYDKLSALMKEIRDRMEQIGLAADRQNLVPHLTLGRIKFLRNKELFRKTLDCFRSIESNEIAVGNFFLYESTLTKEGPVYKALQSFQFTQQ